MLSNVAITRSVVRSGNVCHAGLKPGVKTAMWFGSFSHHIRLLHGVFDIHSIYSEGLRKKQTELWYRHHFSCGYWTELLRFNIIFCLVIHQFMSFLHLKNSIYLLWVYFFSVDGNF